MKSIRKTLLAYLLVIFSMAWFVVIVATYLEARHEIEEIFDAQLSQYASLVSEIVVSNPNSDSFKKLAIKHTTYGHKYERHINFQIWRDGNLLLRSENAPEQRMTNAPGFSDITLNDESWRVYYMITNSGMEIYAGEDFKPRDEIVTNVARDSLYPLVLALPILAIAIWFFTGKGLSPLYRLSNEVASRNAEDLSEINIQPVASELKVLTYEINKLFRKLHSSIEREKQFTADAAHELRTPLAGMKTQAQVALRSNDTDERQAALEKILAATNNGTHLVEQLLTLARLDPDQMNSQVRPIRLENICEQSASNLEGMATEKDIQLKISIDSDLPELNCYPESISILIRNLLDNAVRYTPEGGTVNTRISIQDGVTLTVCDTGPGLSDDEIEKVLNRFYRPSGHDDYGSGLGLSIVKRIAALHNATIHFEKNKPMGLCVKIKFPK